MMKKIIISGLFIFGLFLFPSQAKPVQAAACEDVYFTDCGGCSLPSSGLMQCNGWDSVTDEYCGSYSVGCNLPPNNNSCDCGENEGFNPVTCDSPSTNLCVGDLGYGCHYCATPLTDPSIDLTPTPIQAPNITPFLQPINYARCTSVSISSLTPPATSGSPFIAAPDQEFLATIQMQNIGNTTWTTDGSYNLGTIDPINNLFWRVIDQSNPSNQFVEGNRVSLPYPVAPVDSTGYNSNSYVNFTFRVKAPSVPNIIYNFHWRMLQGASGWFGIPCNRTTIQVVAPIVAGLGEQTIVANAAEATPGVLKTSGLRSGQGGSNYNNGITITQRVSNIDSAALIGAAFTNKAQTPTTCNNESGKNCLQSLVNSANYNNAKGFVLLFAKNNTTNSTSIPVSGNTFAQNHYYAYYGGGGTTWEDIATMTDFGGGTDPEVTIWKDPRAILTEPASFNVRFYSPLGSKTWGTYGYLMQNDTSHTETSAPK